MGRRPYDGVKKVVGKTELMDAEIAGDLKSDVQNVLRDIRGAIVNRQVTINRLKREQSWITHRELMEEH